MTKLEKSISQLQTMHAVSGTESGRRDPRGLLLTSLLYLGLMLSVPAARLEQLIWFAIYPIAGSALCGISFGRIFKKSLYLLPFILFIGIFNPIFDREPALRIGELAISRGWITFVSLTLRGLMAVQALLILIGSSGFNGLCRGLQRLGMPGFLTTQLNLVFRYLGIMLSEALSMHRAREARGYGKRSLPLKMWGTLTGELFIRTVRRAERIHAAMQARGFDGTIRFYSGEGTRWNRCDTVWLAGWGVCLIFLRLYDLSPLFNFGLI